MMNGKLYGVGLGLGVFDLLILCVVCLIEGVKVVVYLVFVGGDSFVCLIVVDFIFDDVDEIVMEVLMIIVCELV